MQALFLQLLHKQEMLETRRVDMMNNMLNMINVEHGIDMQKLKATCGGLLTGWVGVWSV
jgi:hypothetical protein